tara:strand:+ start:1179 stop:1490 length:312 start_codon:yes stop_codon:yes gene_type:complete
MTSVTISAQNMKRAKTSMKRLYIAKFGENCLLDAEKKYSRDELILTYANNLKFWKEHLPELKPGMTEFTNAKHAICTNGMERLWQKCDDYKIRKQVELCIGEF